jgi:hypothetical protein
MTCNPNKLINVKKNLTNILINKFFFFLIIKLNLNLSINNL